MAASAEKEPISKLCDEPGLQPTVFCRRRFVYVSSSVTAPLKRL